MQRNMQLLLTFPTLKLPLHGLSNEVGALLAFVQNGVHSLKRALWQPCRDLLVIDAWPAHCRNIDDITNCYKGYFSRYHLLQSSPLLISSKTSKRREQMTFQTRQEARREQLLRELASDLSDLVASGDLTAMQANEWLASKADQWSREG